MTQLGLFALPRTHAHAPPVPRFYNVDADTAGSQPMCLRAPCSRRSLPLPSQIKSRNPLLDLFSLCPKSNLLTLKRLPPPLARPSKKIIKPPLNLPDNNPKNLPFQTPPSPSLPLAMFSGSILGMWSICL